MRKRGRRLGTKSGNKDIEQVQGEHSEGHHEQLHGQDMKTAEADQGGQEGGKHGRIFRVGWMPGEKVGAVALAGYERLSNGDLDAAVALYLHLAIQSEDRTGGKEGQCA